jgi:hypothetical protein
MVNRLDLLLFATVTIIIIITFFSASAVADERKMSCKELYNITRIKASPARPIDCRVEGEWLGLLIILHFFKFIL